MTKLLIAPLLCTLLALGCDTKPDDVAARALELENSPGLRVTVTDAGDLPEATIHELARHLELSGHDTGAAMVRVKQENDGPPSVVIELWGGTLPQGDIAADLKAKFPALAAASITTTTIPAGQGGGPSMPVIAVDADLSPAEAEQLIRDQLAADGVDGKVDVKVEDGPDGRRVQVGIEKQEQH
jgi:hypothetical protein